MASFNQEIIPSQPFALPSTSPVPGHVLTPLELFLIIHTQL